MAMSSGNKEVKQRSEKKVQGEISPLAEAELELILYFLCESRFKPLHKPH